jgi:hypothetical protein
MKLSSLPVLIKKVGVTSVTLTLGLLLPLSEFAQAASLTSVDLELSLLVDVSGSVTLMSSIYRGRDISMPSTIPPPFPKFKTGRSAASRQT